MGSAYNPTSIVYTKGKTVGFYLNKVGCPTPDAEEGEMYIVKADGSVIIKTHILYQLAVTAGVIAALY